MESISLKLDKVSRAFGGLRAVDDVSFTLKQGETIALIGPNGAGKSTLIQLITGVDKPDAGTIHLGDTRINGLSPERIAALGLRRTFQTSRVFPALSIFDSVLVGTHLTLIDGDSGRRVNPLLEVLFALIPPRFWRERQAKQAQQAEAALTLFEDRLLPRRNDPAFSLSYANRRRLEIARAIAPGPSFLLLDEPTAGMNPTETAELTDMLAELRVHRPDIGLLIVEHKLSLVRRLADRVIVLNQGRVLVEDTPDKALDHADVVEAYLGRRSGQHVDQEGHLG